MDNVPSERAVEPPQANKHRQGTTTPLPSAPEVTSAQDFPSLPTPSKPAVAPPAPATKKPVTIKPLATKGKPVVPEKIPSGPKAEIEPVSADVTSKSTAVKAEAADKSSEPISSTAPSTSTKDVKKVQPPSKPAAKSDDKKVRPKSVDIPKTNLKDAQPTDTKAQDSSTASSSQPETPTKAQDASPAPSAKKPKTIRVAAKAAEKENTAAAPSSPTAAAQAENVTVPQQPATPSDSASFTTTTISRPSSPSGGRVGTAPVRASKSQQKKERQAKARQVETEKKPEQPPPPPEEPAVVQEPIVGRKKKKEKKPKGPKNVSSTTRTTDSTPLPSRPASPDAPEEQEPVPPLPSVSKDMPKPTQVTTQKSEPLPNDTSDAPDRSDLDIKELFNSLLSSNELFTATKQIFAPVHSTTTRYEHSSEILTTPLPTLTAEQSQELNSGIPVILPIPAVGTTTNNSGKQLQEHTTNERVILVQPSRRPLLGLTRPVAASMVEIAKRQKAEGRTISSFRELDSFATSVPKLRVEASVREIGNASNDDGDDDENEDDAAGSRARERKTAATLFDDEESDETLTNAFASVNPAAPGFDGGLLDNGTDPWGNYPVMAAQAYAAASTTSGLDYVDGHAGGIGSNGGAAGGVLDFPGMGAGGIGADGLGEAGGALRMTVEEAEQRFAMLKKETDALEKKLNVVIRKNRKVVGMV